MNKILKVVTFGAIILQVAAIPAFSVFAVAGSEQTDTVTITVPSSCTIDRTSGSGAYSAEIIAGAAVRTDIGSSTFAISCNDPAGWKLQAIGSGTGTNHTELQGANTDAYIPTGLTGDSYWSFKLAGADAIVTDWANIPSSNTIVAKNASATTGSTVTTTYQVKVGSAQMTDTYTGKITYTISAGAN